MEWTQRTKTSNKNTELTWQGIILYIPTTKKTPSTNLKVIAVTDSWLKPTTINTQTNHSSETRISISTHPTSILVQRRHLKSVKKQYLVRCQDIDIDRMKLFQGICNYLATERLVKMKQDLRKFLSNCDHPKI